MATSTRRLDLSDIHAVMGAIQPDLTRTDNKIMTINGHPCDFFTVQTVTTGETNLNLPTRLISVRGGFVKNMTTGLTLAIAVTPLKTDAAVAVVNAVLPADNLYVVVVYGTEIR